MIVDPCPGSSRGIAPSALAVMLAAVASGLAGLATEARAQQDKAKPVLAALDPAASRSLLTVRAPAKVKNARATVGLGRPTYPAGIPQSDKGARLDMLARELLRQSVLIAARDELGLATRDEVIGDDPLQGDQAKSADGDIEVVSFIRDHEWHALVRRAGKDGARELFARSTKTGTGEDLDTVKLVVAAETWSRQAFPGVLKDLGLSSKPNAIKETSDPALPRYAEARLATLGFSQTLVAVRDLHLAMRTKGETPAALGALVRGYAQLGVLSEFHWHPAHRAFKARALLYAQRLVARYPDRPTGLWHRAYALALAGRHRDALADLDAASKLAGGTRGAPPWLAMIDAYARCDTRRLAAQKPPLEKLAALLRMLSLEYPAGRAVNVQTSRAVLELDPLCFRAADVMCRAQGVNTLHVATEIGPQALEQGFGQDLAGVESLPGAVIDRLQGELKVRDLADLLREAGRPDADSGEPSWAALGHLIRETRFVQVWRRLDFMKNKWDVPVDDYWNGVKADVANHRYRPYLETLALPPQVSYPAFQKFAEQFDLSDIEHTAHEMMSQLQQFPAERGKAAWQVAGGHAEVTATELAYMLWIVQRIYQRRYATDLLAVSPYHPEARAVLIELAWDDVKDQVGEWEKQSGDNPSILAALGRRAFAAKKYDDARRLLARYNEQSPDLWAYRMIADSYKAQGDTNRWRETLDDFLNKVEEISLDHTQVRVDIAEYFMARNEWDKATPYADAAGESWAQWAMSCAARCAEGAGRWDDAEVWHVRNVERYTATSYTDWYLFCKRTGHGNLAGARAFTEKYIEAIAPTVDGRDTLLGSFYWLDGRHDKAREAFARSNKPDVKLSDGLSLAILLDETGDAAGRDKLLKEIEARAKQGYPQLVDSIVYVRETLLEPGADRKAFDAKEMEKRIRACPDNIRSSAEFFLAGFLRNHGQAEPAKTLYGRCAQAGSLWIWYQYIAKETLKSMK